jgi:hypothetical protein
MSPRPPKVRVADLEADLADLRGKVNTLCEAMVLITRAANVRAADLSPERPQLRLVRGSESQSAR